jgi:hypothetical protein
MAILDINFSFQFNLIMEYFVKSKWAFINQ